MGIGAYAAAVLMRTYDYSFPAAFLAAAALTAFIAFVVSIPLLKLRDDAFILASFGFSFIAFNVFLNWQSVTNGAIGMKGIPLPAFTQLFERPKLAFLLLILSVLIFSLWLLKRILDSSYGVIIRATRENQRVTQVAGHDTDAYRRSVFVLSSIFASFAGTFLASHISAIDPLLFYYPLSVLLLVMAILGGLASLKGSVIGATLLILLPEALRFLGLPNSILAQSQQICYGLILMLLMYYRPKGLFGTYKI